MFERRLKIFIAVLVLVTLMLISRVFEVQVIAHSYWAKQAQGMLTKPQITETIRGRILDFKGNPMAIDNPCIDACVDYRVVIDPPDAIWLRETVLSRVRAKYGTDYRNAKAEQRKQMLADETRQTLADINSMWNTLANLNPQADQTGNRRAAIEEIRKSIVQSVKLRRQWLLNRTQELDQKRASTSSRLMKWLSGSSENSPAADNLGAIEEEQEPHVVLPALDPETFNFLDKRLEQFPGLSLRPSTHRMYPMHTVGCHLLGSISSVSAADLEEAKHSKVDELRQYQPNDVIGRTGIEGLCEPLLRGTRGKIEKRVSDGAVVSQQDFVPGSDVRLSIDADLQKQAQGFLQHVEERIINDDTHKRELITPPGGVSMHGAVVVIDVKTNQVRVLASNPGFDLDDLENHYKELSADELNGPLIDRATSDTFEPGSTVKPIIGLGAITQSLLGPTETIDCTGYLCLPEISPTGETRIVRVPAARCWILSENPRTPEWVRENGSRLPPEWGRHGPLTFSDALERSCDIFFETAADRLSPTGVDHWLEQFGLGRPTGIGIFERAGMRPSSFKSKAPLSRAENCLSGMGQGRVLATPLQIANEAATIARGGIWMRPKLLSADSEAALDAIHPPRSDVPDQIDLHLSPEALKQARIGMINVVEGGAGTGKIDHDGFRLAAKTGTADASPIWIKSKDAQGNPIRAKLMPVHPGYEEGPTPWYRSSNKTNAYGVVHSWYMGYAPADNPQVAICVLIEYAGAGGSVAAGPVASHILEACKQAGYLHAQ